MRLLAPTLGVLFLAALIGCGGGGGGPSFDQDPDTTGTIPTTDGGNTNGSTTDLRPAAGSYTVALSGSAAATTVTGTGTATAVDGGGVTVNVTAANSSDGNARTANVSIAQNGLATGTVTVGANAAATITAGSIARQSTGVYLLTTTFTNAAAQTETDRFTLTQGSTVYTGPVSGTDDLGGTYSGDATVQLTTGNVVSLTYTSTRTKGVSVSHQHSLSTTLLSNGTFSGALFLSQIHPSVPMTGTWTLSGSTLTLTLRYVNTDFFDGSPLSNPNTTETLTLTKQ